MMTNIAGYNAIEVDGKYIPDGYYVYAIADPGNDEIFYIGKGCKRRFSQHVKRREYSGDNNFRKKNRLSDIIDRGMNPKYFILIEGLEEDRAYSVETDVIDSIGYRNLTNLPSTYQPPTPERQSEMALAAIARVLKRGVDPQNEVQMWALARLCQMHMEPEPQSVKEIRVFNPDGSVHSRELTYGY